MEQHIEARGRVIHAAMASAAQVWGEWGEAGGPDPMVDLDEALDEAVRGYAEHLGMVEWPHLDDEIPAEVVRMAKDVFAVERLRDENSGLRDTLMRVALAPADVPRWLTPQERRQGARAILRLMDGVSDDDLDLYVLPDPQPFDVDLTDEGTQRNVVRLALAVVFLTLVALALCVRPPWPEFQPFG